MHQSTIYELQPQQLHDAHAKQIDHLQTYAFPFCSQFNVASLNAVQSLICNLNDLKASKVMVIPYTFANCGFSSELISGVIFSSIMVGFTSFFTG